MGLFVYQRSHRVSEGGRGCRRTDCKAHWGKPMIGWIWWLWDWNIITVLVPIQNIEELAGQTWELKTEKMRSERKNQELWVTVCWLSGLNRCWMSFFYVGLVTFHCHWCMWINSVQKTSCSFLYFRCYGTGPPGREWGQRDRLRSVGHDRHQLQRLPGGLTPHTPTDMGAAGGWRLRRSACGGKISAVICKQAEKKTVWQRTKKEPDDYSKY